MKNFLIATLLTMGGGLLMGTSSCQSIKYQNDSGFLNSAQANSYEYPLKVAGKLCKDLDGVPGACIKQFPSDQPIRFRLDAQEYGYRLAVNCSDSINSDFSVDVEDEKPYEWKIDPHKFANVRQFTCIGEIFPEDRDNSLSAKWHLRALIRDGQYVARERIYYHPEGYLVLGKHSKYAKVCHSGSCERHDETTVLKVPKTATAYTESEVMRFNSYGL